MYQALCGLWTQGFLIQAQGWWHFIVSTVITVMHVGKPWESAIWMWVCYCFPFIFGLLSFLPLNSLCIEYLKNKWEAGGRINCRESVWLNLLSEKRNRRKEGHSQIWRGWQWLGFSHLQLRCVHGTEAEGCKRGRPTAHCTGSCMATPASLSSPGGMWFFYTYCSASMGHSYLFLPPCGFL